MLALNLTFAAFSAGVYPDRDAFLVLDDFSSQVAIAHFCPLVPTIWYGAVPPLLQRASSASSASSKAGEHAVDSAAPRSVAAQFSR